MFRTQNETLILDSMDQLWLGRMCVGERGARLFNEDEIAALLWATVNRYMLHPGRRHWPNFTFMLRRFSQPINPRWMAGGDLARRYAGRPEASPAKLKRRAKICALKWHQIPAKIRAAIARFSAGQLLPPAAVLEMPRNRISNWASYPSVDKKFGGGIWLKGNYFFEDKGLIPDVVLPDPWR